MHGYDYDDHDGMTNDDALGPEELRERDERDEARLDAAQDEANAQAIAADRLASYPDEED